MGKLNVSLIFQLFNGLTTSKCSTFNNLIKKKKQFITFRFTHDY